MNLANHKVLEYAILAVIFVAVMIYMVYYNLRIKRIEKDVAGGRQMGTEEAIAAATEADINHKSGDHV